MSSRQPLVVLCVGLCGLLSACLSVPAGAPQTPAPQAVISGVVIRNELPYQVTDVMIEVPATGGFAGCGTILPRTECSNRFQHVDYRANEVVVRWREHDQPQQTEPFIIAVPAGSSAGDAFHVEVVIFGPGQAGARLAQPAASEVG